MVSGNVSFYNQTKDIGIKPTPAIGGVGLIKDYHNMVTMDLKETDNILLVVGKTEGHLDQSLFARDILNEKNDLHLRLIFLMKRIMVKQY